MLRIAVLSDIHGNAVALDAVLEDIERHRVNQIWILGDLFFKGAMPQEVLARLQALSYPTTVIKGNTDEWLVAGSPLGLSLSAEQEAEWRSVLEWTWYNLEEGTKHFLNNLPERKTVPLTDNLSAFLFHATPQNLWDIVPADAPTALLDARFRQAEPDAALYAYGHIHHAVVRMVAGKPVINPGSVGLPFDGDPRASYALVEADGQRLACTLRRVPYDVETYVRIVHARQHPAADEIAYTVRNGRQA
ncbi:metallophosphoesterase family protein [Calditerricola yamamurae]